MKVCGFFSAIILGALLVLTGSAIASDNKGAESIILKGGSLGSITFPHGRHQGIFVDCKPCHNLFAKEPKVIDKMMSEGTLKTKEVMMICKYCHTNLAAQSKKAGPTACKDCHEKAEEKSK
jgi:hypothetical protein